YFVNVDGTNLRPLAVCTGGCGNEALNDPWSPDGSRLAVGRIEGPGTATPQGNLWTRSLNAPDLAEATSSRVGPQRDGPPPAWAHGPFEPTWSPEGSQLLSTHLPSTDGVAALYVINADGTGLHVLAKTTDLNESHAVWGVYPAS